MGSMDGVALAKAVRKAGGTMQIVFVTGYSDYIAEGYDVEALNYLMKPVDAAKLFDVLDKAVARMRRDSKCLDLQCAEGLMRIPLADIRYLDVRRNYVTVHTDRDYTVKRPLGEFEAELGDAELADLIGEANHANLIDDIELLDGASCDFDLDRVRHGKLSPVFFGSALTTFGVEPFLEDFLRMTTPPLPRHSSIGTIDAMEDDFFSAFVFKIQANMNKAHRDRIAFMRVVSGRFDADKEVYHVQGKKKLRLSRPQQLMAAEREIIEEAYAGDIIGVFDPGIFSIGDTLCTPGKKFRFDPIPTFAPEHFARVRPVDTMKRKQFLKGAEQIALEGAIQIFKIPYTGMEEVIVGVVGTLQFDVFQYRLRNEYNVEIRMDTLPYEYLRWIKEPVEFHETDLVLGNDTKLVEDYKGNKLLLFGAFWSIKWVADHNPQLVLTEFNERSEEEE